MTQLNCIGCGRVFEKNEDGKYTKFISLTSCSQHESDPSMHEVVECNNEPDY